MTNLPIEITLGTGWDIDGQGNLVGPLTAESAQTIIQNQPSIYWGEILRLGFYEKAWEEITAVSGNKSQLSYTFIRNHQIQDMNHTNFFLKSRSTYSAETNVNGKEYRVKTPLALDRLAKSFYAGIMIDMGIHGENTVLNDPELLQDWTGDFTDNFTLCSTVHVVGPGMLNRYSHDTQNSPVEVSTGLSTIYLQSMCQVPQLKATGSLIGSVVVANLVYLQAIWAVYIWALTWWTKKKDRRAMFCEGCLGDKDMTDLELSIRGHTRRRSV